LQNGQLTSLRLLRPDGAETTFESNYLVGYNYADMGADGTIAFLTYRGSGTTGDPYQSTVTVIRPDGTTQSVTRLGLPNSLGLQVGDEGDAAFIVTAGTVNDALPTTLTVVDPDGTVRAITVPSFVGHKFLQVGADGSAAFLATTRVNPSTRQTALTVMYPDGTTHATTVSGSQGLVAVGDDGTAAYAEVKSVSDTSPRLVTVLDPDGTMRTTTVDINPLRVQVGADGNRCNRRPSRFWHRCRPPVRRAHCDPP